MVIKSILNEVGPRVEYMESLLKALGNRDRLLIMYLLCDGEHSVKEIESNLDITQPSLSQHLSVLRAEGLVSKRRSGKQAFYTLSAMPMVLHILSTLRVCCCSTGPHEHVLNG